MKNEDELKSEFFSAGKYVNCSSFTSSEGFNEIYLTVNSKGGTTFSQESKTLYDIYLNALKKCGLTEDTQVFIRFYVDDSPDNIELLQRSDIFNTAKKAAVSIIRQQPVNGGSVSLLACHIKSNSLSKKIFSYDNKNWRNGALIRGNHYELLWTANFSGTGPQNMYRQTYDIFQSFDTALTDNGMTLFDNAVRTWIYIPDIDNRYSEMVRARKDFFKERGLTPETHFIASTGIGGISKEKNSLLSLDALAIKNLEHGQNVYLRASENMPPTNKYGVTFERGTRVRFGDRSHIYISGTASIDRNGGIMHVSDVGRQTVRSLNNIRELLTPQGARLEDMAYLIVYLRSSRDRGKVMEVIGKEVPHYIPLLIVEGSICRPEWLVEVEGLSIIPDSNDFPAFF